MVSDLLCFLPARAECSLQVKSPTAAPWGFVSEDEFLSIPEFSTNPLSQVCLPSSSHREAANFVPLLALSLSFQLQMTD